MGQFILKKDTIKLGIVLGLITPVLGIALFYYWKFSRVSFAEFWDYLKTNKSLITNLSMVCLFLNIVVFTLYLNVRKDQTAKGIFAVTVLFALVALVFKFVV